MAQLNKTLYVAVGIPGSGKSYYFLMMDKMNRVIKRVSRDDVRFSILQPGEKYFSHEQQVYKEFIKQIQALLDDDTVEGVCADATHLTKKSRQKLFNALDLSKVNNITIVWHNTPIDIAIERNERRTGMRQVPAEVIRKMAEYMEPPTKDEHPLIKEIIEINE